MGERVGQKLWDKTELLGVLGTPVHGGRLKESVGGRFEPVSWQERMDYVSQTSAPPDAQWLQWNCLNSKDVSKAYVDFLMSLFPLLAELAPESQRYVEQARQSWHDLETLLTCIAILVEGNVDKKSGWLLLKPCVKHASLVT